MSVLQTRRIGNNLCAVAFEPTEIQIRNSGRMYFGTEKPIVELKDGQLIIYEDVAKKFGIAIKKG